MENNNINLLKMRIDLSAIPEDIIPIIAKYLLEFDITYKFNKIFRKRNDNKLLKYFFGNDENIFRILDTLIILLVMIIKLNVKKLIFNL